jgi:prepilin-type N-terminal cleavage/methylation domain-containing protein
METLMKTAKSNRQRGFSLAEILVAVAIFAIIMVATLLIYDRSNRVFKNSVENAEMQQNTRAAFDRVVADVRMAGFDYDRDGVPVRSATAPWQPLTNYAAGAIVNRVSGGAGIFEVITAGQSANLEPTWPANPGDTITDGSVTWRRLGPVYQQPDEQIEFAGRSAVTIRGNFDYSTDVNEEHGRERAYEPVAGQFPIVTTANDEIVTYALRRVNGTSPDTLSFYADVARPRAAYPGGSAEALVSIPNVDLCATGCNNPPYTLLRFTIQPNGTPDAGTPVATNVRDIRFNYFTDAAGQTLLTDADGGALTQGAIGGLGQFDPANIAGTANWDDRTQRSRILTVRVGLTGMGEAPDRAYSNPAEATTSPARNYRTYSLESNVKPRNLGLSGFAEPNTQAPGPPTITSVCVGSCNITRVTWTPPASGNVSQYEIHYDTSTGGNYNIGVVVPGDVVSAPVFNLTPGTLYFFKVVAINENGRSSLTSTNAASRSPVNSTRPSPVTDLFATDGALAEPNQIRLSWTVPATNDPALANISCYGTSMSGADIDPAEPIRFRIWRGTTLNFNPMASPPEGEVVLESTVSPQPTGTPGLPLMWVDDLNNALAKAPANCKDYYYRIQVYDTCSLNLSNPAANNPNAASTGQSTIYPLATPSTTQPAIHGYASSSSTAAAPGQPSIDYTNGNSTCSRGPNTCDVKLLWPQVTTDMSNPTQTITVDQYRIRRERKKAADTTWSLDTILPIVDNASTDASLQEGNNVVFHDTTAIDHDPLDKRKWYYRYTVTAIQCGSESTASPAVQFPANCGLAGSAVIESGARSGDGSAAAPWVMNATDYIQVQDDLNLGLRTVEFEVYPEPDPNPNNAPVDRRTANTAPFQYFWNDQADGAVYRVVITMTNNNGCTEQTERFIQDDPISCPSATVTQAGASSGSGVAASPWIMGLGDTVTVNQPAGATITSVRFALFDGVVPVGAATNDVAAPFQYTWSNQVDNRDYRLVIDITYSSGLCAETVTRIIRDEPPPVCTGATAVVTGAAGGDGLAVGTPWVLNAGDTITITPATGGIINGVVFAVTPVAPAGAALPSVSRNAAPFSYTWSDLTDNTVYRIVATITYAPGCTETVTRYVQDQICSGATVTQTGSVGAGTGLTSASPWVFNAADKVTVTAPTGATISNVQFNLYQGATTTLVATGTDASAPFESVWVDRTDNQIYRLEMTVTYSAGCSELITRYIQDQSLCFISASTPTLSTVDSGSRKVATITFTISNPSTEALTISGVQVGWFRDAQHPEAVLTDIAFNNVNTNVTSQDPPTTGVITPTSPPVIPAGNGSYTVAVVFDIGKKNEVGALASNWISSLCIRYSAPSFGAGNTASCNVLGSTTGNPTSCN